MKKEILIAAAAVSIAMIMSCGEERPSLLDGSNVLNLLALDTSRVQGDEWIPIPHATVKINCTTSFFKREYLTDDQGWAVVDGLPAGNYEIMMELVNQEENVIILGQKQKTIVSGSGSADTIFMSYQKSSPLVINELYTVGCRSSAFYYYDQFMELYNSSQDTIYLDGYIICRGTHLDELVDIEEVDFALAYYVYEFPGTRGVTKLCPIAPGQFLAIASDAIDHQAIYNTCVNLLVADYEFFCSYSHDYDNLSVPNLTPVTLVGNEFSMNLGHEAVWIATGEEWSFGNYDGSDYVQVPIYTIIDGVEYDLDGEGTKYLTVRVDGGRGGVGLTKYSARSMQRRFPGLDSNNSSFDFEINSPPTPGYQ